MSISTTPRSFMTACPVVRIERMTLFLEVRVNDHPRLIGFETEIFWLRSAESRIVWRHAGEALRCPVNDYGYNDYYGFLSCVEGAFDDLKREAKRLYVCSGDKFSLDIDVRITETPCLEDPSAEAKRQNANPKQRNVVLAIPGRGEGGPWYTSDEPVEKGDGLRVYPRLEVKIGEWISIYSTARDPVGKMPERLRRWVDERRGEAVDLFGRGEEGEGG